MGFPRQEYWSSFFLFPLLEDLPDSGIRSKSPACPAFAGRIGSGFFFTEPLGKPIYITFIYIDIHKYIYIQAHILMYITK